MTQMEQLLSSIKSHKSCEHDMLHPKLLKISAPGLFLAKLTAYGVAEPGIALMQYDLTGGPQRVKVGGNVST